MPFPVSFRGSFAYPVAGQSPAPATAVADRIEGALRALGARDVERDGCSLSFTGPSRWTAARSNPLVSIARGNVEVVASPADSAAREVRYAFRTTRELGFLVVFSVIAEAFMRFTYTGPVPRFLFPGLLAFIWGVNYVATWVRVPLLLMRAAAGERTLEDAAAAREADRDGAT